MVYDQLKQQSTVKGTQLICVCLTCFFCHGKSPVLQISQTSWRYFCCKYLVCMNNNWPEKRPRQPGSGFQVFVHSYCWWKKFRTSWYGKYSMIYRVLAPSQVVQVHQQSRRRKEAAATNFISRSRCENVVSRGKTRREKPKTWHLWNSWISWCTISTCSSIGRCFEAYDFCLPDLGV